MRSAQLVDALRGRCLLEDLAVEERLCLHRELRELGELMRGGETQTKGEVDGDPDELSMLGIVLRGEPGSIVYPLRSRPPHCSLDMLTRGILMEGNLDLPARSALTAVKSDADPVDIHDSSKHRRSSSPTANAHQRDRLRAARRSPPTETIPRRAQQQQSGQQSPQRRPMSRTQQAHAQIQPAHFQKPAPSLDSWFAAKATLDKSGGLPAQLVPGSGRPSSVLQADVSSHTPHSGLGNVRDFRQDLPASDPRRIGLESRLKRQSSDDTGELAAALNGMTVKTETQITATGRRPPLPVQWGSVTLPKRKETPVNVCFNFNLSDCDGSCHKDHVCARCHSRSHSSRACTLPQMKGGI